MNVQITQIFKRAAKKLHRNQVTLLEEAIQQIQSNPTVGDAKVGDLAGVRVYKFHMHSQLILLAYTYDEHAQELILLSFASHENFYSDLKKIIK